MELIKIGKLWIGNEEIPTVDARILWEFLEVKRKFADWIVDQIERGRFVKDRDYVVFHEKVKNPENIASGGRPTTDYHFTLDTAKHIAMMSNTEKGHEVREYFIECEARLRNPQPQFYIPRTFAEALRLAANQQEQIEAQGKQIKELEPKAAFADAVNDSSNSMDLGTFAKILGTGRTRLFEWLREEGFLMANSTKPYQRYIDNGYFVVIETMFTRGDTTQTYGKTQICGKGQLAIEARWRESRLKEAAYVCL